MFEYKAQMFAVQLGTASGSSYSLSSANSVYSTLEIVYSVTWHRWKFHNAPWHSFKQPNFSNFLKYRRIAVILRILYLFLFW